MCLLQVGEPGPNSVRIEVSTYFVYRVLKGQTRLLNVKETL